MANKTVSKIKKKVGEKIVSRPKPSSPRAGFLPSGRRYGCGGKTKK